jgi:Predicted integral membrane protein (DUF2269)
VFLIGVWSWFTFWLILHIMAVIVAFGPTFAFGLIATFGQKHPQFALASAEISDLIEKRMTIPIAVIVPFLGLALIYSAHIDLWRSTWLLIAIPLYIVLFFFGTFVEGRNSNRMVQLLRSMPPGPPPEGAAPPPELVALGRKLQLGGMFLGLLILAILVLMVWQPGNCFTGQPGC